MYKKIGTFFYSSNFKLVTYYNHWPCEAYVYKLHIYIHTINDKWWQGNNVQEINKIKIKYESNGLSFTQDIQLF